MLTENDLRRSPLADFMTRKFTLIIEQGEDGYIISDVLELPGCHTQAKTYDELLKRTREAILLCLESVTSQEIKNTFLGLQQIEIEV